LLRVLTDDGEDGSEPLHVMYCEEGEAFLISEQPITLSQEKLCEGGDDLWMWVATKT